MIYDNSLESTLKRQLDSLGLDYTVMPKQSASLESINGVVPKYGMTVFVWPQKKPADELEYQNIFNKIKSFMNPFYSSDETDGYCGNPTMIQECTYGINNDMETEYPWASYLYQDKSGEYMLLELVISP